MDPIAEIRERFKKYPDARYEAGDGWIRYVPCSENGFVVELQALDEEVIVAFDGWHEHFPDNETALNCFAFGLSDACRLKIVSRGGRPHKWIVEELQNGYWVADSETGLLFFQFWRRPRVIYLQNAIIKTSEAT